MSEPEKQQQETRPHKDPELFEKSYLEEDAQAGRRPPYIYIVIIVFVILSFFWKIFMSEEVHKNAPGVDVPEVSRSQVAKPEDMMK